MEQMIQFFDFIYPEYSNLGRDQTSPNTEAENTLAECAKSYLFGQVYSRRNKQETIQYNTNSNPNSDTFLNDPIHEVKVM